MARIIGTRHADRLFAPDEPSVVRGRAGNDHIEGGAAFDQLYGDRGEDTIIGGADWQDEAWGGWGNDYIELAAFAHGGRGSDTIIGARIGIGGWGNDFVSGIGDLYGGEAPGIPQAEIGNDTLFSVAAGFASTRMTGGLGADSFLLQGSTNGTPGIVEIMDFVAGVDKIGAGLPPGDGTEGRAELFDRLDANDNGVLEWSDSLGPDGDPTTPDGGAVYADGLGTMWLGLNASFAGATTTDANSWLIVHGTNQIAAADWIMV